MIKIAKKKGIESFFDKISELMENYNHADDEEDDSFEEDIEDNDREPFITRMTKCYNFLVDAVEYMPVSSSKEFKFVKDKNKAKSFFLKLTNFTTDYHDFLNRMKQVVRG